MKDLSFTYQSHSVRQRRTLC